MARSRQRLADFEARSVQLIAACTLGLAGMSALHATPTGRVGAQAPTLNTTSASAIPANTRFAPSSPTSTRTGRS